MEQAENVEKAGSKGGLRLLGLLILVAALVYFAPRFNELVSEWKKAGSSDEEEAKEEVVDIPQPHADWIPLIEKQLPVDDESSYEVLHVRLSDDGMKLLVDLKIVTDDEAERADFILHRDEFGRYVSENDALPMKLYLPDVNSGGDGSGEGVAPEGE